MKLIKLFLLQIFKIFFISLISINALAAVDISISSKILHNTELQPISQQGSGPLASWLGMNVQYDPIKKVREIISDKIGYKLNFLKSLSPEGEAHITVVTPPEFSQFLKKYISMSKITEIAKNLEIQKSDIKVLGIGHGILQGSTKKEENFFIIVHSENLLKIRNEIYKEYIRNGGPAGEWNPDHYYPHITIGYSNRDLHEADGVIKDVEHSLDPRFNLIIQDEL